MRIILTCTILGLAALFASYFAAILADGPIGAAVEMWFRALSFSLGVGGTFLCMIAIWVSVKGP